MSDKDRQKKDGREKSKQNQARRAAEAAPAIKRAKSAHEGDVSAGLASRVAERRPPASSSPSAARAHASKADKGK
jgi:hypothetical protein